MVSGCCLIHICRLVIEMWILESITTIVMAPLLLLWALHHCFSTQAAAGGAAAVTDKKWASKLRYRMRVSCDSWLQSGAQEERTSFFFYLPLRRWLKRVHQQKQSSTCLLECNVYIQEGIFNHSKWIFIHFSLAVPFLGGWATLKHFCYQTWRNYDTFSK